MCRFLSSIGLKNGDILCDPNIDSHEDLVAGYKLNDNGSQLRNWVRLEYAPDDPRDYGNIKKYKLNIDDSQFCWITDSLKEKWERKLIQKLKKVIITSDVINLSGGTYILTKINVDKLFNCRIIYAGRSTIKYAGYSTIEHAGDSTIIKT